MANAQLSVLVQLQDEMTAQLRTLNQEVKAAEKEWRYSFKAIANELRDAGQVMAVTGGVITGALGYTLHSALKDCGDQLVQFEGQWRTVGDVTNEVKATFRGLIDAIGSSLFPALAAFLNVITPIIQNITNWINENRGLAEILVSVALGVGGVLMALGSMGILIPKLILAVNALKTAWMFLNVVMDANPIGLICAAAGILLAIFGPMILSLTQASDASMQLATANGAAAGSYNSLTSSINNANDAINRIKQANINGSNGFQSYQTTTITPLSPPNPYSMGPHYENPGMTRQDITVNVHGSVVSEKDLIDTIYEGILRLKGQNYNTGF